MTTRVMYCLLAHSSVDSGKDHFDTSNLPQLKFATHVKVCLANNNVLVKNNFCNCVFFLKNKNQKLDILFASWLELFQTFNWGHFEIEKWLKFFCHVITLKFTWFIFSLLFPLCNFLRCCLNPFFSMRTFAMILAN